MHRVYIYVVAMHIKQIKNGYNGEREDSSQRFCNFSVKMLQR